MDISSQKKEAPKYYEPCCPKISNGSWIETPFGQFSECQRTNELNDIFACFTKYILLILIPFPSDKF